MWRWIGVWVVALLSIVLLSTPTQGKAWVVKTKHVEKKGITLNCSSTPGGGGRIVGVSVVGMAGNCRGLTARMFVEMTSCLWREGCHISKSVHDNYMVKLLDGSPPSCITQKPHNFSVSYECAANNVKIFDVLGDKVVGVKDTAGIVRSHEYHPWLYMEEGDGSLTLNNPSHKAVHYRALAYTIRTLRLMYDDVLRVTSNDGTFKEYSHDVTSDTSGVIDATGSVTFELETSEYSTGGEGFVLCFQWVTTEVKDMNACTELVSPGQKPARKRKKKPKRQRRNKNGKNGKKGRKGKKGKKGKKTKEKKKSKKNKKKNKEPGTTGDNSTLPFGYP